MGAGISPRLWALQLASHSLSVVPVRPGWGRYRDPDLNSGGVLLATCERREIYGFGELPDRPARARIMVNDDAARQLIRVAAGLESAAVGEDQILHQVRRALATADPFSLRTEVRRLFETAIATGRRARVGRLPSGPSLVESAFGWLRTKTDLSRGPVMVVGTGRMGRELAVTAGRLGAEVIVASRTPEHARRLAREFSARPTGLRFASQLLDKCSAVLVALSGPWHQLSRAPQCAVVDISAPTAIPARVRTALGDRLFDLDQLLAITQKAQGERAHAYRLRVEPLVAAAHEQYMTWLNQRISRASSNVA